jgi:N-methylhydantoinase A
LGLLLADYRHDYIRSIVTPLDSVKLEEILAHYRELKDAARADMHREGVPAEAVRFEQYVDLKYGYQLQELTLPFPAIDDRTNLSEVLARLFVQAHDQAFGYHSDDPIELVSLRLRALASAGKMGFSDLVTRASEGSTAMPSSSNDSREVYFGRNHGLLKTPIRSRRDIGGMQRGPMIVEEPDTTVVVPPGWSISSDGYANLTLAKL